MVACPSTLTFLGNVPWERHFRPREESDHRDISIRWADDKPSAETTTYSLNCEATTQEGLEYSTTGNTLLFPLSLLPRRSGDPDPSVDAVSYQGDRHPVEPEPPTSYLTTAASTTLSVAGFPYLLPDGS